MGSKYYVVLEGRETGIFTDWDSCNKQVYKYPGAKFKSFKTREEAEFAFNNELADSSKTNTTEFKPENKPPKHSLETLANEQVQDVEVDIKVFTDGACDPNPGQAGSGIAIYREDQISELRYGLYNPCGTNNTAELNALHQALIISKSELDSGASVAVFCDSKYAIQCVTQYASDWKNNGWKRSSGGEIKNLELIQEMYSLYQSLEGKIQVFHVNGHVGIEGNELADRMSVLAIDAQEGDFCMYQEGIDIEQILLMRSG
jgi:ribonuclease HI